MTKAQEQHQQLKEIFEELKQNIKKRNQLISSFNSLIEDDWDISYNDTDDDAMIDTLDYGTNFISFKEFKKRMDWYNSDKCKGSYDFYNN